MVLADVNILIAAWRKDAQQHAPARKWLQETIENPSAFAFSELVGSGFLRIATHPAIFNPPSSLEKAQGFLTAVRAASNCVILSPGERHWNIFNRLCEAAGARGNLVSDAYHAALAIEHGCEWVTFDRGFRRFDGLKLKLL